MTKRCTNQKAGREGGRGRVRSYQLQTWSFWRPRQITILAPPPPLKLITDAGCDNPKSRWLSSVPIAWLWQALRGSHSGHPWRFNIAGEWNPKIRMVKLNLTGSRCCDPWELKWGNSPWSSLCTWVWGVTSYGQSHVKRTALHECLTIILRSFARTLVLLQLELIRDWLGRSEDLEIRIMTYIQKWNKITF